MSVPTINQASASSSAIPSLAEVLGMNQDALLKSGTEGLFEEASDAVHDKLFPEKDTLSTITRYANNKLINIGKALNSRVLKDTEKRDKLRARNTERGDFEANCLQETISKNRLDAQVKIAAGSGLKHFEKSARYGFETFATEFIDHWLDEGLTPQGAEKAFAKSFDKTKESLLEHTVVTTLHPNAKVGAAFLKFCVGADGKSVREVANTGLKIGSEAVIDCVAHGICKGAAIYVGVGVTGPAAIPVFIISTVGAHYIKKGVEHCSNKVREFWNNSDSIHTFHNRMGNEAWKDHVDPQPNFPLPVSANNEQEPKVKISSTGKKGQKVSPTRVKAATTHQTPSTNSSEQNPNLLRMINEYAPQYSEESKYLSNTLPKIPEVLDKVSASYEPSFTSKGMNIDQQFIAQVIKLLHHGPKIKKKKMKIAKNPKIPMKEKVEELLETFERFRKEKKKLDDRFNERNAKDEPDIPGEFYKRGAYQNILEACAAGLQHLMKEYQNSHPIPKQPREKEKEENEGVASSVVAPLAAVAPLLGKPSDEGFEKSGQPLEGPSSFPRPPTDGPQPPFSKQRPPTPPPLADEEMNTFLYTALQQQYQNAAVTELQRDANYLKSSSKRLVNVAGSAVERAAKEIDCLLGTEQAIDARLAEIGLEDTSSSKKSSLDGTLKGIVLESAAEHVTDAAIDYFKGRSKYDTVLDAAVDITWKTAKDSSVESMQRIAMAAFQGGLKEMSPSLASGASEAMEIYGTITQLQALDKAFRETEGLRNRAEFVLDVGVDMAIDKGISVLAHSNLPPGVSRVATAVGTRVAKATVGEFTKEKGREAMDVAEGYGKQFLGKLMSSVSIGIPLISIANTIAVLPPPVAANKKEANPKPALNPEAVCKAVFELGWMFGSASRVIQEK